MRKYLILLGVLAVLLVAGMWWLGEQAVKDRPDAGEVRIPIDNVFGQ